MLIVASKALMMTDAPVVATPISRSLSPNSSPNEGSMERVESWNRWLLLPGILNDSETSFLKTGWLQFCSKLVLH
jgi:hypothetical protein